MAVARHRGARSTRRSVASGSSSRGRRGNRQSGSHAAPRRAAPARPRLVAVRQLALAVGQQAPPRPVAAAVLVAVILAGHLAVVGDADRVVVVVLPAVVALRRRHRRACERDLTCMKKPRSSPEGHRPSVEARAHRQRRRGAPGGHGTGRPSSKPPLAETRQGGVLEERSG